MFRTPLGRLRLVGFAEAASWAALLVAMGFRKFADNEAAVRSAGWVHGVLFMLYVAAVAEVWASRRWPFGRVAVAGLAAVVPFGTLALDPALRREQRAAG